MIKVTNDRTRGNEAPFKPIIDQRTPYKALITLLEFELGYGGEITYVTPTKVSVVTRVLDCVDTTTFEGSEADMHLLFSAAATHVRLRAEQGKRLDDLAYKQVMELTKGVPLLVNLGWGLISGQPISKLTALCLFQSEDERLKNLVSARLSDLIAAVCLYRIDGIPFETVLTLFPQPKTA